MFDAAADASPEERGGVLDRLCRNDPALLAEVEALLAALPNATPRIQGAIGRFAGEVVLNPPPRGSAGWDRPTPAPRMEGERHAERAVLHRGELVNERFTIDCLAETGGMGEIYRAIDDHSGEPVAIKVLRRDRSIHERRFEREAQLLAGMAHRHIVRYVAHGTLASGEHYLAMEWLEGEGLDERLQRQRLTLGESVRLGLDLAETLGALHERGIVHRDVKPNNVFLAGGALSELRLLDLGIAWSNERTTLTQTGLFVGSLRYAAPEQVIGTRSFDARTDVFALGLVLFECLAGTPAFENERPVAVLTRVALGELPRLRHRARGLPEPLVDLVDRMLARDPRLRPFDGAEVARALRALGEVAEVETAAAPPATEIESPISITTDERSAVAILLLGPPAENAPDASDDALVREAERHGGHLEWLGDGAATVLVTGSTVATDLAARAARCALALRGVSRARPITLAVGPGDTAERSALGPTIDRAARLLTEDGRVARADAITLDAATVGLLDGRFEVRREDGGGLVLVGERGVTDVRTLLGRPTPCVGRERELRLLEELFEDCVRDGQAQAVLVTAPPGTGKTRLGAELLQRLRARDTALWTARASLMGAGSTLGMVVELVQAACGVGGSEPLEVQRRQLRDAVTARFSASERSEQQRLAEFLGEIIAVRVPDDEASPRLRAARQDASLMGDQIRAAFVELLAAEATARPVVLLLEDLHWADSATIRLIAAALRELAARPLYMIALARPEAHELFPEQWTGRIQRLSLTPLSRRASEQLVRHVLGDEVSDEVLAQVVRLADGNAFYLEELIRATAEGQSTTELPGSAVAMVQSRLAGLDEPLRRALRAASVFGEIFWTGGVASLTGDGPGGTEALVQRLVELELVTPRSGSRLAGQTELTLRHALLREGAYGMLTPTDRTLGHQLAGDWLERHGERDPLVLAEHFDRGGQGARAAAYYLHAATSALGAGDSALALQRARQGLAAGVVDEVRIELLGVVLEAKTWKLERDPDDARIADEILAHARPGSLAWEQAAFTKLTELLMSRRVPEALTLLNLVLATPPAPLAISPMTLCLVVGAWFLEQIGITREGDVILQRAIAMMNGFPEDERFPFLWLQAFAAARASYRDLDPWRGLKIERSLEAARAMGFMRAVGICEHWLGFSYACLGAAEEARATFQRASFSEEALASSSSIRPLGRAWLAFQLADLDEARRQAERLLELGRRRGFALDEARGHWILAELARRRGDLAAAEAAAEAALALAVPMDRPAFLATLAGTRLAQGRTMEALAAAEEAMTLYRALGFCSHFFGTALLRVVHIECLLAAQQHEQARDAAADGKAWLLDIAARIGDPRYRATFLDAVPEHRRILDLAKDEPRLVRLAWE